jgi:DNA-directed RNA polymerase specialized sigma24 family protein
MPNPDSINGLTFQSLANATLSAKPSEIEHEVMELHEQFRDPLIRYALSLDISFHDAEEVIQEVFLSLFRHLQMGRSRANLRGWLFRVTHNLGLKQHYVNQRSNENITSDWQSQNSSWIHHPMLKRSYCELKGATDCWRWFMRSGSGSVLP